MESIFKNYGKKPIFLCEYEFNQEEAQVICNAMINNPHFAVIAKEVELEWLDLAFESKGYVVDEVLNKRLLISDPKLYGCVFKH